MKGQLHMFSKIQFRWWSAPLAVLLTVALFMALDSWGLPLGGVACCVRCSWAASALFCCMASTGSPQNKHPTADTTPLLPAPMISVYSA
jgi:hypothetical protein